MITKKIIQEKIDNLTEQQLNQVYGMIEELSISEDSNNNQLSANLLPQPVYKNIHFF